MTRHLRFAIFAPLLYLSLAITAFASDAFDFSTPGQTPPASRPGMFIGRVGDKILAGGGLDAAGKPTAEAHTGSASATDWQAFTLETPIAFAGHATVSLTRVTGKQNALVIAGGIGANGLTDEVRLIEWKGSKPVATELPRLPLALAMPGVGFFDDQKQAHLWVIGGTTSLQADSASSRVFRLLLDEKSTWEEMPPLPGTPVLMPGVACFYNDVHVFGGFEIKEPGTYQPTAGAKAFRWKPMDGTAMKGWRDLAPLPRPLAAPLIFQTGQVHVALAGGVTAPYRGNPLNANGPVRDGTAIQIYHNVTDSWVDGGNLPAPGGAGTALQAEKGHLLFAENQAGQFQSQSVTVRRAVRDLAWQDYLGLFGYFVVIAFIGLWFTRKQTGSESFALADRKIPWWIAGISMFATGVSSISFMAIPAQAFRTNLIWATPSLVLIPLFFLEAYLLYPLIRRLRITSTYEYLERRFHPSLRYLASAQCIALQVFGRMSMVLLLPALAIAAVTGLNVFTSVLLMGVVTTIYTVKGGLKAVMLTEAIQGATMLIGIALIVGLAISALPDRMGGFIETSRDFQKFDMALWTWDETMPVIWILILTPIFTKLAFAADQPVVQRVFATPLKDVRKLAAMFLFCSVFISFAVNFAGISIFSYFKANPAQLSPTMTNDQIVPLYIVERLPVGVAGLIIATVFAAAASTLAGGMNSVAILFTEDFVSKFKKDMNDRVRLRVMRLTSLVAGVIATGCALYMAGLNQRSLFQTWNELFALLGGGFLGIYILGTFTRRANATGAITGALVSVPATFAIKHYSELHWAAYMPAAVMTCVVVGYIVSLFTPASTHDLAGLTVFDMKEVPDED
jgi:SSS family transporter